MLFGVTSILPLLLMMIMPKIGYMLAFGLSFWHLVFLFERRVLYPSIFVFYVNLTFALLICIILFITSLSSGIFSALGFGVLGIIGVILGYYQVEDIFIKDAEKASFPFLKINNLKNEDLISELISESGLKSAVEKVMKIVENSRDLTDTTMTKKVIFSSRMMHYMAMLFNVPHKEIVDEYITASFYKGNLSCDLAEFHDRVRSNLRIAKEETFCSRVALYSVLEILNEKFEDNQIKDFVSPSTDKVPREVHLDMIVHAIENVCISQN